MEFRKSLDTLLFDPNQEEEILDAVHKDVTMTVCIAKQWISIYYILSRNPGHGEADEAIRELKKLYPKKKFFGNAPLHPAIEHLFKKHNIFFEE